jgi:N-succinyldiaminopimelate aminotransferase
VNPDLARLQPYPFERLRALLAGVTPAPLRPILMSIGEPQHPAPTLVLDVLREQLGGVSHYPSTLGAAALRTAIAQWLTRRFGLAGVDAERQVLPVNGTREALFAFAQTVVARGPHACVLAPNPFYQIYEGAALLAGADFELLNIDAATGQPDYAAVPATQWQRCQLLYICTPGNPTGAVLSLATLQTLLALADEHDFIIASDECYSELYPDETQPPPGLLQACAAAGRDDYRRCVVFHSLSKRSNLPGLRSGFVAGDADILRSFLAYRTYHGCAMPPHHQAASAAAWQDERHVVANRDVYRAKFDAVLDRLGDALPVSRPDAGFYLWPQTPVSDTVFAQALLQRANVTVLPGSFLGRDSGGHNPGSGRVRLALVAGHDDCVEASERIAALCRSGDF